MRPTALGGTDVTPIQLDAKATDLAALEQTFRELAARWEEETWFLSSPPKIIGHPAFQAIIALGPAVVPLMLRDLERQPHLWVWALPEITGENPVPEGVGNVTEMSRAWVQWGRERGLKW
jgi:hypothetical protein